MGIPFEEKKVDKNLSRGNFTELGCKIGAGVFIGSPEGYTVGRLISIPNRSFVDLSLSKDRGFTVLRMYETS